MLSFQTVRSLLIVPLLVLGLGTCPLAFAQTPPDPTVSSYIEETSSGVPDTCEGEVCSNGVCKELVLVDVSWIIHWSMSPYPITGSINEETTNVWFGPPRVIYDNPSSSQALDPVTEGETVLQSYTGCTTSPDEDAGAARNLLMTRNPRVTANFVFSIANIQPITSPSSVLVQAPPDVIPKTELASQDKMSKTKDPINLATGEMIADATDYAIPARGPDLVLGRTYRSKTNFSGLFGHGWRTAFDINLREDADGNVIIYDEQGTGSFFFKNSDGTYLPSSGNFSTLVKNTDGTFTITSKYGESETYSAAGRLSRTTDRSGNALKFVYAPSTLNGTYIESASGRRITLTIDAQGRVTSAKDPAGRLTKYAYDANGHLITITDPANKVTQYVYDANHNIVQMTNVNGHKTYFAYDASDRATMNWQDGDVNKAVLTFQPDGSTVLTDSLGKQSLYRFNAFGLETSMTDALGNVIATTWDNAMNRTAVTDGRGNTTRFNYDAKGNLVSVTDALGRVTNYTYTANFNLLKTVTDALGQITTNEYDAAGNLTKTMDPLGNAVVMTYDSVGNLLSITDALNHATTFVYNTHGEATKITNALNGVTTMTYDSVGNVLTVTAPNNGVTQNTYNSLNRLITQRLPDTTTFQYAYDAFGNPLSVTDPKARKTTNVYDLYERLSKTTNPAGGATLFAYDKEGRLLTLTDPKGQTTVYAYDALGRKVSETTAGGKVTAFSYDAVGNLIGQTDPNGQIIQYTYDALNRLTRTDYPDGSFVAQGYDALGRRTVMTDELGTTAYTYDALGRVLSVDGPEAADTIHYTYDAVGNRKTMATQDGRAFSYTYDALNRLLTVAEGSRTTGYSYDAMGNITSIIYPNGGVITTTYNVMNRPLSVINKRGILTLSSFAYAYDTVGQITQKTLQDNSKIVYKYDAKDQLTSEVKTGGTPLSSTYNHAYTYDLAGNRLSMTKTTTVGKFWTEDSPGMPAKTLADLTAAGYGRLTDQSRILYLIKTYAYANDNRLLNWEYDVKAGASFIDVETVSYAYDHNGNRTSETRQRSGEVQARLTEYMYDFDDRLINIEYINQPTVAIASAAYEYNGDGIRTKAVEGGVATKYYYDGWDVLFETDGTGTILKAYSRAVGFVGGIGGLISQRSMLPTPKEFYYYYDALGSVVNMNDDGGSVKASYEYDAFGNAVTTSDNVGNTYQFSSKEREDHAGLIYFGARYYDPVAARWLTPDPMGMVDGPNRYLYVNNNPLNLVDPYGLMGEKIGDALDSSFDWFHQNAGHIGEFGLGAGLHALGSAADLGTITLGVIAIPTSGGSLALVPVTISVSTAAHVTGTGLMAHALYSMSESADFRSDTSKRKGKSKKKSDREKETRKATILEHWNKYKNPRDQYERSDMRKQLRKLIKEFHKKYGGKK